MFDLAENFNQCLSSWVDKTQTNVNFNVNLNGIFTDSGCPNKDAVATVGPWRQDDNEQCFVPSKEDCSLCNSSTVNEVSGYDFRTKVAACIDGTCPEGVPIGC